MNSFEWTNKDVVDKLQARKEGKILDADVQEFLKSGYDKEVPRMTIFRHLPASTTAEPEGRVIELKSKFGGTMLAVRDGQEFRAFMYWRGRNTRLAIGKLSLMLEETNTFSLFFKI
uniref:Uncharacterized protein n=1 Tax=Ditylenchus dipsaci TaxID=166011 RepID=A0A915DZS5_9BILA